MTFFASRQFLFLRFETSPRPFLYKLRDWDPGSRENFGKSNRPRSPVFSSRAAAATKALLLRNGGSCPVAVVVHSSRIVSLSPWPPTPPPPPGPIRHLPSLSSLAPLHLLLVPHCLQKKSQQQLQNCNWWRLFLRHFVNVANSCRKLLFDAKLIPVCCPASLKPKV